MAVAFLLLRRGGLGPSYEATTLFKDTTNIVFMEPIELPIPGMAKTERRQFTISNSTEVAQLVAAIGLRPKEPCPCQPHYEATFQEPSGQADVSFCDHCFAVYEGKHGDSYAAVHLYRMPKDFYAQFRKLAEEREHWRVRRP